jgi:hypothetical protein
MSALKRYISPGFLFNNLYHYNMYVLRLYVNFTYVYVLINNHFIGEFHYDN